MHVLVAVWSVAINIMPLLPYIFIIWIADAGVASVKEGSITPIGYAFSTILTSAQALGSWLVAMAHALWNVITFWS